MLHTNKQTDNEDKKQKRDKKKETIELIKSIVMAFVCAFVIRSFIFEPYTIPSGSMKPNFMIGDYLIATKYDFGISGHSFWPFRLNLFDGRVGGRLPKPGEVVIFRSKNGDPSKIYIKRLIAGPADSVRMDHGNLYVNDKKWKRELVGHFIDSDGVKMNKYIEHSAEYAALATHEDDNVHDVHAVLTEDEGNEISTFKEFTIPDGHYFMMGDNRDRSNDSRLDLGLIPEDYIIGKPKLILFSMDCRWWEFWKYFSAFDSERLFLKL